MTDPAIFDPRDLNFKNPYGAVPSGTVVCFTLRPPRAGGYSRGRLTARFESRNNEEQIIPLPWVDSQLGVDQFRGTLDVGTYVGLVWYSFVLEGLDGRRAELGPYQLTVYQGEEAVPTWFGEGMTYQIFPDRFCRSRIPDPTGLVGGRTSFSRRRRTTAMARRTMTASTPCWAATRTSPVCATRPTSGACG